MSSEPDDSGPDLHHPEDDESALRLRGDPERTRHLREDARPIFECRENAPAAMDQGGTLRAALYGLPLRAGFTDEVLARIRRSAAPRGGQTPIP